MRTLVRRNEMAITGYEMVIVHDDGTEEIKSVTFSIENIELKLPENPANRKWLKLSKMGDKNEIELEYKETRTLAPRAESAPRKGLEEYLEGEDKEMYLKLVEKARKAREEANKPKPMTELEKKLRAYEKAKAQYEALLNKGNE